VKPRRTPTSNVVFHLVGGTEDNDLWAQRVLIDGEAAIRSVWELSDDDRQRIAEGANIELAVWGPGTPPVSLIVTDSPVGRG
jgi:hypothetical protein